MMRDLMISVAVAFSAIAAVWLFWPEAEPMPETSFHLTDGRILASSELRGRSVLINFWSVSCEVCLQDMPTLTRLHESLAAENFMVLAVAAAHDPPPAVISMVERLQPGYPVALDVHGEISAAFGGIETTPTSILVRPDGKISDTHRGPIDEMRIRATLLTF
jgi:thiol-disulfide isomerase/thioredoxin